VSSYNSGQHVDIKLQSKNIYSFSSFTQKRIGILKG